MTNHDYLETHPPPWSYDDEDTATQPYIQIYSDAGTVACLVYANDSERQDYLDFARYIVDRINEPR